MSKKFLMSGQMIKRLKIYGIVNVNGIHARVVDKVNAGDWLYLELGDTDFKLNRDPEIPVLFENEWYAVINKPSGIVTHPTHGHLDDSLITRLSDKTLHPVMRLDRETSGLIIIAKNGYAHNTIHEHGDIKKTYTAVVYGKYEPEEGLIDYPIRRREGSVMIRDCAPDGKESKTLYKTLKYNEAKDISLVEFKLITGRCHQIRCHSTFMGHPLAGDGLYGPNSIDNPNTSFKDSDKIDRIMGRCALHCSNLKFFDPIEEVQREYSCELPQSFIDLFAE
ncbi:MAG: RluA family pseudouridine synthase [Saccharofermentans sp.]|nr:RluA family pseudouridine synthase [Saccharofermentans sp.]